MPRWEADVVRRRAEAEGNMLDGRAEVARADNIRSGDAELQASERASQIRLAMDQLALRYRVLGRIDQLPSLNRHARLVVLSVFDG